MNYIDAIQAVENPTFVAQIARVRIPYNKYEQLIWTEGQCSRDVRLTVLEALGQLTEVDSAVLIARSGEGLTLAQYGERIDRSRERVRQIEAKALRRLRNLLRLEMDELSKALAVVPVPEGPFDPNWVTTKQAAELTDLTMDHVRYLCRERKVVSRRYEHNRNLIAIGRNSLKFYVLGQAKNGRRRGVWKGG